jgi:hypothetical protein
VAAAAAEMEFKKLHIGLGLYARDAMPQIEHALRAAYGARAGGSRTPHCRLPSPPPRVSSV